MDKFAGGDQAYLRDEQYRDGRRLTSRADLHRKYSTAPTSWLPWIAARFDLRAGATVLEAGCGTGWVWEQSDVPIPPGVELTLTDLSPGMVAEAQRRAAATGRFGAVAGQPADVADLPFADASFDRVIADHMLYHLPDPGRGVAELARVVRPDGTVIAATNGRRHVRELWQLRGDVFGTPPVDRTVEVFGAETGFPILRDHFGDVRWIQYHDELHCTDPADVMAYVCSVPPAEDADGDHLDRLAAAIHRAFDRGTGTMVITKDVGCFVCTAPLTA